MTFNLIYTNIPPLFVRYNPHICIHFRVYNSQNFYIACVSSPGKYKLRRVLDGVDGVEGIIQDWTDTDKIYPGADVVNSISLIANENQCELRANDELINSFTCGEIKNAGEIKLIVYLVGPSEITLEIDDLVIKNIP